MGGLWSPRDFSGHVVSIIDGDTLEVLHNRHPERIRLSGIDCPEKGQAYGKRAKETILPAFRTVCLWRGGGALVTGQRETDVRSVRGTSCPHTPQA